MAGLRELERRLEKLEERISPPSTRILFWDLVESDGNGGMAPSQELIGCHSMNPRDSEDHFALARDHGESEEAFMDRAEAAAKAHNNGEAYCLVIGLVRYGHPSDAPVRNPEPRIPAPEAAKPAADPAPVVHIPLPKEKPKPQVRFATIKETEGQYADRPSWYA